jgi:thiamine-phosphate pyrophosphorylase
MFPRLYAILDVGCLRAQASGDAELLHHVLGYARALVRGGVKLIQYRAKDLDPRAILSHTRELRRALPREIKLIMNDRADLCLAAGFDGVHVGQNDLSPDAVRGIVGPERIVGVSTHNPEQFAAALQSSANYVAIGPVFATGTKLNPDPVVGFEGVRAARQLISNSGNPRPLVAIGGITRRNARQVIEAGADSAAVIADLLSNPEHSAEEFLRIL